MGDPIPFPRQPALPFDPSWRLSVYSEEVHEQICRVVRHYGPKAFADHLGMTVQQLDNCVNKRSRHHMRVQILLLAALLDTTDGVAKALMSSLGRRYDHAVKRSLAEENEALKQALRAGGKVGELFLREAGIEP